MNVSSRLTGSPLKALVLLGCMVAGLTASPRFDPNWSRLPAGTEIPELRTATSHTYSNGDGTFTADITPGRRQLAFGETDSTQKAWPTSTGDVGRWIYGNPPNHYDRETPLLYYCGRYEPYYLFCIAYAKFDLTPVPDSSEVVGAQFRFYQYQSQTQVSVRVTGALIDPDSATDEILWLSLDAGLTLAEGTVASIGWVEMNLNAAGDSLLNDRLAQNWVTLGIDPTSPGYGTAYGVGGGELGAHLLVEYTLSGVYESLCTVARQPALAFAPSPAAGRFVTVRYAVAAGTRGKLTLRDVLGRTVKSFTLDPSGSTRLDLRGFAPGIYMATLDASGQYVSRKLILTARWNSPQATPDRVDRLARR